MGSGVVIHSLVAPQHVGSSWIRDQIGIFLIAKLIEFIFSKAEIHAYYGIIGLILASPIAILMKTNWSGASVLMLGCGVVTFALGWFVASKLGGE